VLVDIMKTKTLYIPLKSKIISIKKCISTIRISNWISIVIFMYKMIKIKSYLELCCWLINTYPPYWIIIHFWWILFNINWIISPSDVFPKICFVFEGITTADSEIWNKPSFSDNIIGWFGWHSRWLSTQPSLTQLHELNHHYK
jgi:hypothetical protein